MTALTLWLLLISAQNPCGVLHFTRDSEGRFGGFSKKLFLNSESASHLMFFEQPSNELHA